MKCRASPCRRTETVAKFKNTRRAKWQTRWQEAANHNDETKTANRKPLSFLIIQGLYVLVSGRKLKLPFLSLQTRISWSLDIALKPWSSHGRRVGFSTGQWSRQRLLHRPSIGMSFLSTSSRVLAKDFPKQTGF